jgi:hypothetical protein
MFVEDLQGYDVARVGSCATVITCCSEKGWEPQNQVHLEGHEEEVRRKSDGSLLYEDAVGVGRMAC